MKKTVVPRSMLKDFDCFVLEGVRKREWAENKGYNHRREYSFYHPKFKMVRNPVVFLTQEELFSLYRIDIPRYYPSAKMLTEVKDMFCFCCFTSLRYSDMINLKTNNIKKDRIIITTQKTSDTLTIETNIYAKSILDRYLAGKKNGDNIFPQFTNSRMNLCLKTLGQMCGFNSPETIVYYKGRQRLEKTVPKWECLSTHCARRTFICNALASGVNAQTIMKWTGHSDYSAMKPYIDVTDEDRAASMLKIFSPVI